MTAFEDLYFNAPDGLRLHVLAAGTGATRLGTSARLPAICLPGLARTAEDFREVMQALSSDAQSPRRVLALDSRGRGKSERDPNPANYSVPVELADLLAVLAAAGIERAIFVGTSRGGILTMALTAAKPGAIAGAVLNDIGPVLDMAGLLRIKGYVGKLPKPASMADAAAVLKRTLGSQFPGLSDDEWRLYARRSFVETAAGIEVNYDPKISPLAQGYRRLRAGADDVAAVRRARARAPDADPRRAFGLALARDGRGNAEAPARHGTGRGAGPGPRAACSPTGRPSRGFAISPRAATRTDPCP